MKTHGKQTGFTLTELLASLIIFAILAIIAVPLYIKYVGEYQIRSAAEALNGDLNQAHSIAIETQQNITVVFQSGANWCYGVTSAATCNCNTASSCNYGQANSVQFSGSSLSISGFPSNITVFEPTRGVPSLIGSMVFTGSNGDNVTVQLNKMGLPSLCSTTVGGYPASC